MRLDAKRARKIKKNFDKMVFWLVTYPSILFIIIAVFILISTGRIKIRHKDKIPSRQKNLIIAPNHPSLWEPVIIMAFMPLESLFHPIQCIPWSTPDETNYKRWFWALARQRFIFVPRGNLKGELRAMVQVVRVLRTGKRVIIFGEGGRTGKKNGRLLESETGKHLKVLKRGLGRMACQAGSTVLPVWIEGAERILPIGSIIPRIWRPMIIRVGEPFQAPKVNRRSKEDMDDGTGYVNAQLTQRLLKLADEKS